MNTNHQRPLFHEKTVDRAVRNFAFPSDMDSRKAVIAKWIDALNKRTLEVEKEVSVHGKFLGDIFGKVLGYSAVVDGINNQWTLQAEATISDGGGSADAALGFFTAEETGRNGIMLVGRVIAPIELKGVRNDLDRPCLGRTESAVDQGWRYMQYTENCEWLIVSNYREIRLYKGSKTPGFCEKFLMTDLADEQNFHRFFYLLCAQNFLPVGQGKDAKSIIDHLFAASESAEADITRDLYSDYKAIRLILVEHLQKHGPADVTHEVLIEKAQKLLDRVLFVAFCEDRGLLPKDTIRSAHDHKDPYNPTSVWTRYKAVFSWVDKGRDDPPIPGYNGGLFRHDPILDDLIDIPDAICTQLNRLTRFDFDTDVSVEVLGHIFEQSVTDLEELKAASAGREFDKKKGTRKTTGVYYTPTYITQYIVDLALGGHLRRREEELRTRFDIESIPESHRKRRHDQEIRFWEAYRDEVLKKTRVLDPACGSGAFLIAAFDYLHDEYQRVNEALAELQYGQYGMFDLNEVILSQNLFGVDLSKESVEITKLSLWLKTAAREKQLTTLDHNIQHGNSIVADPAVDPAAFVWGDRFKDVTDDGGFDVVIGNPPYVRQELLSPFKPYLQKHFQSFDGVADLYTYFYERGFQVLKNGGSLSFIVTNKWLKSGYGEALRRYYGESAVIDQIVDFGHAPIFEDADTFPCIILVHKPDGERPPNAETVICPVPREKLGGINLSQYVSQYGYSVSSSRFGAAAWSLEHPDVDALMEKIRRVGVPLRDFADVPLAYGIKTGFNEAFFVSDDFRTKIVTQEKQSTPLFVKYLRGQDVRRWHPEWAGLWMLLLKSSNDFAWRWSSASPTDAERIFERQHPLLFSHFKAHEEKLRTRSDQGRYWWELRSCAYYHLFDKPKIVIQRIAFHSRYSFDNQGTYLNDAAVMLPKVDNWTLACLHSPANWYLSYRHFPHKKDEALAMDIPYVERLPIAVPPPESRREADELVPGLIDLAKKNQESSLVILDWLTSEFHLESPGNALSDFASLDQAAFIDETRKRLPKKVGLTPNNVRQLNDVYREYALPIQTRNAEMRRLEARLSDLVNQAYQLTPDEIALMWRTAPPRMPGGGNSGPDLVV